MFFGQLLFKLLCCQSPRGPTLSHTHYSVVTLQLSALGSWFLQIVRVFVNLWDHNLALLCTLQIMYLVFLYSFAPEILLKNVSQAVFWSLSCYKELKLTIKPFIACTLRGLLIQMQNELAKFRHAQKTNFWDSFGINFRVFCILYFNADEHVRDPN